MGVIVVIIEHPRWHHLYEKGQVHQMPTVESPNHGTVSIVHQRTTHSWPPAWKSSSKALLFGNCTDCFFQGPPILFANIAQKKAWAPSIVLNGLFSSTITMWTNPNHKSYPLDMAHKHKTTIKMEVIQEQTMGRNMVFGLIIVGIMPPTLGAHVLTGRVVDWRQFNSKSLCSIALVFDVHHQHHML